jgi:hypothetical protein
MIAQTELLHLAPVDLSPRQQRRVGLLLDCAMLFGALARSESRAFKDSELQALYLHKLRQLRELP